MLHAETDREYAYRGVVAINSIDESGADRLHRLVGGVAGDASSADILPGNRVITWGNPLLRGDPSTRTIIPGVAPRTRREDLTVADVGSAMQSATRIPREVLPPLWAMQFRGSTTAASVDRLGFAHLYYRELRDGAAISTSARALALLDSAELCDEALALQSLVGWQMGSRSLFADVHKLPQGGSITIDKGRVKGLNREPAEEAVAFADPAQQAAAVLRDFMDAYLDDHPDSELQLTGGLDSRILLAAVRPSRRREIQAMTLSVPSSTDDVRIASDLASRYRMRHKIITMDGLELLAPPDAFRLALTAARRLDSAADPIALAAVDYAELSAESRPRIGGLGGEVVRGFYYFGPVHRVSVTRRRVERLARWRVLANEAAPSSMFDEDFAQWAADSVIGELESRLRDTGHDWARATDDFYLNQRMHRWAGVLASATAMDRSIVNPMLDATFLAIGNGVDPRLKKRARYLSQILMSLDEDLARIPLDARPAPQFYAQPGPLSRARTARATATKVSGKVVQRLRRSGRPPEGGQVLSSLIMEHIRSDPSILAPLLSFRQLSRTWLDRIATGYEEVEPSAVAMLVNLLATRPEAST